MLDRAAFLADAQRLLAKLEKDLRARCDDMPEVGQAVTAEYKRAKDAGRTGQTLEEWRADAITQQAVAWVLSCVFVRFLEDNRLIDPPKLAGPGERLHRARDEHELYFRSHPHDTDREYLLSVFDDLAKRAGTRDLFGEHNPIRQLPGWLSPDAAKDLLLPFFQRIDAGTGHLVHDFTDPSLDTRFLGDLYQDLSEVARKKYALLQTPVFVEEFILERTLEPAIREFGLEKVRLIDPACGSGHFLLGAFARLLDHWTRREPATPRRELVQRALATVHGVDLNPYAVAIARFRLLLAAWQACGVNSLANAPEFRLNLACGDSLLHGSTKTVQGSLGFPGLHHHYQPEDREELERLLRPATYHAVVANPPYITPKDRGLNEKYRDRYSACYRQYSLAVPFMQRIFDLACEGGFTGQITANSFMKREFGKRLIEEYFPTIDLTHVIDTSGAYIPAHGTPTVILFGRNRRPVGNTIRTVMGIRGEPVRPDDPSQGQVWMAMVAQIDQPGSQSAFMSVTDSPRESFHRHPWSIGGGGAAELKEQLEEVGEQLLAEVTNEIGFISITKADDVFVQTSRTFRRTRCEREMIRPLGVGEEVRDWSLVPGDAVIFPYDENIKTVPLSQMPHIHRFMWPYRTELENRRIFGGETYREAQKPWHEYGQIPIERAKIPQALVFACVATHNHFLLDRGGKVFNRHAPVIKLPGAATEDDHLGLLGLLNSSAACFWMKQVFSTKGSSGIGRGVYDEAWEKHHEFAGTGLGQFPLPAGRPLSLARQLDALARDFAEQAPARVVARWATDRRADAAPLAALLDAARTAALKLRGRMIALQEDLDWQCYRLYGLIDEDLCDFASLRDLSLGQRAFEIVLARKMRDEGLQTTWFVRHGSTPTTETDDPLTLRCIAAIESNPQIALIEQPEYKRRWSDTPWEEKVTASLHAWLLDRLESYFDLDGRMQNDLTQGRKGAKQEEPLCAFAPLREVSLYSVARVADAAGRDSAFQTVAELYRGRPDFDLVKLVTELVEGESVPLLPVLRYKPSGLDKRRAWERTWELQRQEDAIDQRATKKGIGVNEGGWKVATDDGKSPLNPAQVDVLKKEKVGPIPPPPKYKSADFQKGDYWRLRGSLDVPKERWVSFPHCEGTDGLPLIAWAGYDHLQLAKAIAAHYVYVQEQEGGRDDPRLVPLLACLIELLPWLKQWHNEIDPEFNMGMGDYFEGFVQDEARQLGRTIEDVRAWQPPGRVSRRRGRSSV
jgi:N-6 DNA Methylase